MKHIREENRGFTLIEIIITIAIASIIVAGIYSLQSFGLNTFNIGTSQAEIQQDARLIDEVFRREVRNAVYIGDSYTDSEGIGATREMFLSGNNFHYGEASALNLFNVRGISNFDVVLTSFDNGSNILRYEIVIETNRNDYNFDNSILLNNTSIESASSPLSLKGGKLYYRLHGEGEEEED